MDVSPLLIRYLRPTGSRRDRHNSVRPQFGNDAQTMSDYAMRGNGHDNSQLVCRNSPSVSVMACPHFHTLFSATPTHRQHLYSPRSHHSTFHSIPLRLSAPSVNAAPHTFFLFGKRPPAYDCIAANATSLSTRGIFALAIYIPCKRALLEPLQRKFTHALKGSRAFVLRRLSDGRYLSDRFTDNFLSTTVSRTSASSYVSLSIRTLAHCKRTSWSGMKCLVTYRVMSMRTICVLFSNVFSMPICSPLNRILHVLPIYTHLCSVYLKRLLISKAPNDHSTVRGQN